MCALYVLHFPQTIKRSTFRALVILILLSWAQDFLYLFIFTSAADEDEEDGGMEYTVRRFSRIFSYISFIFRFVVLIVFWKDSVDFSKIVRNRNPLEEQDDEPNLEKIIEMYDNE